MFKNLFPRMTFSSTRLIILLALFWMTFANYSLFTALLHDYPLNAKNALFLITAVIGFTSVIIIALTLFCWPKITKPLVIVLLIASAMAAYFMDTYHVLIDDLMIRNTIETDTHEAGDLLSLTMMAYLLLLGILPSILVWRSTIVFKPFLRELFSRVKILTVIAIVLATLMLAQGAAVASFFREHKTVRYYANPANYTFGLVRHVRHRIRSAKQNQPIAQLGEDAKIPDTDKTRELVIVVVGETARADRFSLNGYSKHTNPLLEKQDVVSFSKVRSCATLTAVSVPCMFSVEGEANFNVDKAKQKENVLDVFEHAGANVLWRDNNSSSKGVADRAIYQNYRNPKINTICDDECRDEGMLVGLQDYIDDQKKGDIVIVLHQMGNHGPAYYKRYPKKFEKFTPACQTNELADCSREEINNAYDNAILYTDYFLNQVVELLKRNDRKFETAMLYVSDHGESLGENNVYLHGLPNFAAPETQRHVPMIMWLGKNFRALNNAGLRLKKDRPLSHDNISHTLLGIMEIQTDIYKRDLDLIRN